MSQILFVITASAQSSFPGRYTPLATAAQPLKDSGIQVYALGVGPNFDEQELNDVASRPENVYQEPFSRLADFGPALWDDLLATIRNKGNLPEIIERLRITLRTNAILKSTIW